MKWDGTKTRSDHDPERPGVGGNAQASCATGAVIKGTERDGATGGMPALSSGYRLEIERMQGEILDYLVEGAPHRPTGATA